MPNSERVIKIVGAVCFILIIISLIILNQSPATGYEASIFTFTPVFVWVVVILTFICGLGIILQQLYTGKHEENNLWVTGLCLIVTTSLIVFSVHIFRSYVHLGGDITTHLAYIQNINISGHFEEQNVYPVLHVYLAQLSQLLQIDTMRLILYIPVLFNIIFMLSIHLLARAILVEKGQVILATVAGLIMPLYFIVLHATPINMADMLIPFAFLICLKYMFGHPFRRVQFVLLLLAVIFLLPMFHPVTTLAVLVMLVTIPVTGAVYQLITRVKSPANASYRFAIAIFGVLFIWSYTWVKGLNVWEQTVLDIRDTLIQGASTSGLLSLKADIAYAVGYGYSVVEQFFKVYALPVFIAVVTLIALMVLIYKLPKNDKLYHILAWCGPLGAYFIAMVVAMGSGFGLFLGRTSRYLMMIGAIFVGFIFYEVFKKTHGAFFKNLWQKCGVGLLVIALVLCFINLVFSSHASRYILAPNDQITQAEITGVDWFIHNKEITLSSVFLSTQGYRLKYLSLPYYEAIEREDIRGWPPIPQPPYHFNYDKQDRLGESYDEHNYMVLNRQDRLLYSEVWPEIAERRFQPGDFEKLEKDNSLDRVYINNGMDIWYIHAYSTSSGS